MAHYPLHFESMFLCCVSMFAGTVLFLTTLSHSDLTHTYVLCKAGLNAAILLK